MKAKDWQGFAYYHSIYTPRQRRTMIFMDRLVIRTAKLALVLCPLFVVIGALIH